MEKTALLLSGLAILLLLEHSLRSSKKGVKQNGSTIAAHNSAVGL